MNDQNTNRTKWLHVRLKPEEFEAIQRQFKKTTCRKLSEYARKVLMNKPVVATTRNLSHDAFMAEAIRLRNELNNIGNNFNQAVKKLHTLHQIPEFRQWLKMYEGDNKIVQHSIDEVKKHIQNLGEKWLQ